MQCATWTDFEKGNTKRLQKIKSKRTAYCVLCFDLNKCVEMILKTNSFLGKREK